MQSVNFLLHARIKEDKESNTRLFRDCCPLESRHTRKHVLIKYNFIQRVWHNIILYYYYFNIFHY